MFPSISNILNYFKIVCFSINVLNYVGFSSSFLCV